MSTYVVSPLKVTVDKILEHHPTLVVVLRGTVNLFNAYHKGDELVVGEITFILTKRTSQVGWKAVVFNETLRERARILRAAENRTLLLPDSVYELLDAAAEKDSIDGFHV